MEKHLKMSVRVLRCHSKYLVSLEHSLIYDSKNRTIELINGELLPVGKDRRVSVKRALNGSEIQF